MVNEPLGLRTLNRTLLARQLLLERAEMGAQDAVGHLIGLQSQTPLSPYPGLWTRLAGFDFAGLGALLTERRLVRLVLMRNTVHLVTAADAAALRPWLQPMFERSFRGSQWAAGLAGADQAGVVRHGRRLLREQPRTPAQLRTELGARYPAADPASLVNALRSWLPLVQLPPRGVWGRGGGPVYSLLEEWTGAPQAAPDPAGLVRRYLAAFGPATPADMQKWCGLTGLRPLFAAMDLRRYAAEDGRVLYDLPDAELADPAQEVSARLVADFDNLLLSHADRGRILAAEHRSRVITVNGLVRGTVLVDGFVGGTWQFERGKGAAAVVVTPFARLRAADRSALEAEALRLLAAADPGAAHRVRFGAG
ncbi:winged helix DNA-binding domain-containing protein [Streptomyces sp. V4-01]|uniref:Winged helix DNA-binding domain-containing protein n=1 Tax=Actinacidiphila polyblastidii TaxID=3110430 RepID=A0ABU7PA06_9ACTN|nr:winged helix DNA-binding domain-containing protein [Streptomyces sp. V4-01]